MVNNENIEINIQNIQFSSISVVDPMGRFFTWEGRAFRAINSDHIQLVNEMFECGLVEDLFNQGLIPKTWKTNYKISGYDMVLEHACISPVTYPYEWAFSMLKDAAICTIKVNQIARKYGFETKDCHGYNILFDGSIPKYVDLGSFIKINGHNSWRAILEFYSYFIYPLKIWSQGGSYIARSTLLNIVPPMSHFDYLIYQNPIARIIPFRIVALYVKFIQSLRYIAFLNNTEIYKKAERIPFGKYFSSIAIGLKKTGLWPFKNIHFESLIKKLERIKLKSRSTEWGDYHNTLLPASDGIVITPRFQIIVDLIISYQISTIVELAANQGVLSHLLIENSIVQKITCTDSDDECVDKMYKYIKLKNKNFTPLILNFMCASVTSVTAAPEDRLKAQCVIAMAVTHHLLLTQKFPIHDVFHKIAQYSNEYVLIEFMPLGLLDARGYAPPVPEWYTTEWFRSEFNKLFDLLDEKFLERNRLLFFGRKRNAIEPTNV